MNPPNPPQTPSPASDDEILARIRDVDDLTVGKLLVPTALRNIQRSAQLTIDAIEFGWLSPFILARLRDALANAPKPEVYYGSKGPNDDNR